MDKPLTILYFAWLRERIGLAEEQMALPDRVQTAADLVDHLSERDAIHAAVFRDRKSIRCAVNQEFVDSSFVIKPGDEVAFFPPVTGG